MTYEKKYLGKYTLAIRVSQSEASCHEDRAEGARAMISNTMAQLAVWLDHYGFECSAQEVLGYSEQLQSQSELQYEETPIKTHQKV